MGNREAPVNDEKLAETIRDLRDRGRWLLFGVNVPAATLPRSRQLRRSLEVEAKGDKRLRVALEAAYEAERTKPGVLIRRQTGEIRIY